jgi:TatA/E family protein of Tat protein translocase
MFGLGSKELVILAGIFVLLFGSKRIPELARSIGDAGKYLKGIFSNKDENTTEKSSKSR